MYYDTLTLPPRYPTLPHDPLTREIREKKHLLVTNI